MLQRTHHRSRARHSLVLVLVLALIPLLRGHLEPAAPPTPTTNQTLTVTFRAEDGRAYPQDPFPYPLGVLTLQPDGNFLYTSPEGENLKGRYNAGRVNDARARFQAAISAARTEPVPPCSPSGFVIALDTGTSQQEFQFNPERLPLRSPYEAEWSFFEGKPANDQHLLGRLLTEILMAIPAQRRQQLGAALLESFPREDCKFKRFRDHLGYWIPALVRWVVQPVRTRRH